MPKYSKKTVADAILALEAYANRGEDSYASLVNSAHTPTADDLAFDAWYATTVTSDMSVRMDALEAAARLREGSLPGTPGWER